MQEPLQNNITESSMIISWDSELQLQHHFFLANLKLLKAKAKETLSSAVYPPSSLLGLVAEAEEYAQVPGSDWVNSHL